ncbi:TIGR02594 family protein [Coralloluteibacterium stylophorae]|uniref:TIGR02594 family protein n=1 Tax=Coralloluteibacterium stylophorae TaxID=1776034 RepID=A0A8J8AWU4_9GAMM|nr:TIGR02594 family protein [Coralloluteibacterium stylophorae]MBS7455734.1 TIGR02594 family protein [Coralloluteibacterium stylophorae]
MVDALSSASSSQASLASSDYVVRAGDTMSSIAERSGVGLADLLDANPQVRDADRIQVGQALTIPDAPPQRASAQAHTASDAGDGVHPAIHAQLAANDGGADAAGWMGIAERELGQSEVAGAQSNARIMEYHDASGFWGPDDSGAANAWCGSFVSFVMKEAGYPIANEAYRAREWANWGDAVPRDAIQRGDVVVFQNHVGFVDSVQGDTVQLLGGNQSNSVNVAPFDLNDAIAIRRPSGAPSAPAPSPAPAPGGQVTVQAGDTLSAIAGRNGVGLDALLAANPQFRGNPDLIHPGDTVTLPGAASTTVTVRSGDTLSDIAQAHGVSLPALLQANPHLAANPHLIHPGQFVTVPAAGTAGAAPTAPVDHAPAPVDEGASARADGRDTVISHADGSVETRSGGTLAWRNNNPGNIRAGDFADAHGAIGTGPSGFAVFPDRATGVEAIGALLQGDSYRNLSVNDAISRYAPPVENDTASYQRTIENLTGLDTGRTIASLSAAELSRVVDAIQVVEGWQEGSVARQ